MNDLLEQIEDPILRARIKNTIPRALAEWGSEMMAKRAELGGIIKRAKDMVKGRNRKGKPYGVEAGSPRKFLRNLKII